MAVVDDLAEVNRLMPARMGPVGGEDLTENLNSVSQVALVIDGN